MGELGIRSLEQSACIDEVSGEMKYERGAQGSFTVERLVNLVTGFTSGSFQGPLLHRVPRDKNKARRKVYIILAAASPFRRDGRFGIR